MQEYYNYQPRDVLKLTQAEQPKEDDSLLLSIPSQLLYGFLEGMTTLPVARWAGDEPDNTTEQIANSLGSLMGFVGINPIGVGGKIASKLFVKSTMGKYFGALSKNTRFNSLPMYLGNKISNKISQIGLTPALEAMEFTRKSPILKDMAQQSLTLGLQMGIGGAPIYDWSLGAMEDRMKSGIMGALFGAGNAFVGNTFTRGGKYDVNPLKEEDIKLLMKTDKQAAAEAIKASDFRNGLVRAGVSGMVFSMPSILEGAPLPIVIYDAALNAVFGYKESPYWMKQARAISEQFADAPHLLLDPEYAYTRYKGNAADWKSLDPRVRDTLQEMADIQLGGMIKNAEENISIPGLKVGEVLRDVYQNFEVVDNNVEPKEGQIRKIDKARLEEAFKVQDIMLEARKEAQARGEVATDEMIAEKVRQGLVSIARDTLGVGTRLGTYELFNKLQEIDTYIGKGLTTTSQWEIDKAYKDNGLSSLFQQSLDKIVNKTFPEKPSESMFTQRYTDIIKLVSKYTKDKTLSYQQFEKEMVDTYGIEPDKSFRHAYLTANQSVPRLELTYENGQIQLTKPLNERDQKRPVSYEPKPIMYDMLDGDMYEFSTFDNFIDIHQDSEYLISEAERNGFIGTFDGGYANLIHKLYNTKLARPDGTEFNNLAFYSGHKDQSKLITGKFVITPEQAKDILATRGGIKMQTGVQKVINAEGKEVEVPIYETIESLYTKGKNRFIATAKDPQKKAELAAIYEHSFANNIAFMEKFHNKTLGEIAVPDKDGNLELSTKMQKNWMLEPFSLMKRTQGLNSRQIRMNAVDIAEELYSPKEKPSETPLEGQESTTKPKPTIDIAEREKARQGFATALGDERYIILNSVNGNRDSSHTNDPVVSGDYKFKVRNEKTGEIEERPFDAHLDGGALVRDDIFEAMLNSVGEDTYVETRVGNKTIKVELGAYKGLTIHRGDGINSGMFSKKAIFKAPKAMSDWMRQNNYHTIEYDTTIKVGGSRKGVDYTVKDGLPVLSTTPEVYTRPWDSNTYLKTDETYKINHPQRIMKQLLSNIQTDTPQGVAAVKAMFDELKQNLNSAPDFEVIGLDKDGITPLLEDKKVRIINEFQAGDISGDEYLFKELLNDKVGLIDRLTIFMSNRDSKSWRYMRDQIFDKNFSQEYREDDDAELEYFKDFGIVNKLFDSVDVTPSILASVNSMRNYTQTALKRYLINEILKPKVKDAMTSTLTPQFAYVNKHIKRGEIWYGNGARNQIVDWKTGKTLEQALIDSPDGVEVAVIRAPADSPSGIRILKVKGFIDAPGTGAYTHPDEYYNLGGADNDIDKITTYFKLPKEVHEYYKTMKDQWYDKDGAAIPPKQSPEFLETPYSTIPFDALSSAVISRNAYKGNHILGPGLNHANRMLNIHTWIRQKKGGRADVSLYAAPTEENLRYFRYLEEQNKAKGLTEWKYKVGNSKGGLIRVAINTTLGDKELIQRHQRDIVNYAADASNGEPVKDSALLKQIINRDMWTYPELNGFTIKDVKELRVYPEYSDTLYDRLTALDSIYSDRNYYNKITLPSGREVPARYTVPEIFAIAQDYHNATKNNLDILGGVEGYAYKMYAALGEQAEKYLTNPNRNKNAYAWIGHAESLRKMVAQLGDWLGNDKTGKSLALFHFGKSSFGTNFPDNEYLERARTGVKTLEAQQEAIAEARKYKGMSQIERQEMKMDEMIEAQERAMEEAMSGRKKKEKWSPDFIENANFFREFAYETMLSDFRANDVMDVSSIIHVMSKGKTAFDNHTFEEVKAIRDSARNILRSFNEMKIEKKKGNKTIEDEWVVKATEFMQGIKSESLRNYAESLLVSSVISEHKTLAQHTYPHAKEILDMLNDVPNEQIKNSVWDMKNNKFSPVDAYYFYSKMSDSEIRTFAESYAGNANKMANAMLKLKENGRNFYSSGFNDAIARLPFIQNKTLTDLFKTYQTIIDYSDSAVKNIEMSMKDTAEWYERMFAENKTEAVPVLEQFKGINLKNPSAVKQLSVYDDLQERLKVILKRLPHLAPRLEGYFIDWQTNQSGVRLPVTFKDMTLPQFQKFVDYVESKAFSKVYELTKSAWYKTPQDVVKAVNFYDVKTNRVLMKIMDGKTIRTVKVDIPSSRANNSIVIGDFIQESYGAAVKAIEKLIASDGDEEILLQEYKVDSEGNDVLDENGNRVSEKPVSVINPNFIKAQLPYDDFMKLQEYAIAEHEESITRFQSNIDDNYKYLKDTFFKAKADYLPLEKKVYAVTFKNRTKLMKGNEVVKELQNFFKAINKTALRIFNDRYHYKRLFNDGREDPEWGYGIRGYEDSKIIRITDFLEKMNDNIISGMIDKYTKLGLNVHQLIGWNSDVYHYRFKLGDRNYKTIEQMLYEQNTRPGSKNFWFEYGRMFETLKAKTNSEGNPLYPILHHPPKEVFDMPRSFRESYFPRREHTKSAIRERMEKVLKKAAPNSEEYRKAQLWLLNEGKTEVSDIEDSLRDSLFQKSDDKKYARITASVSGHLKARNGDFFIPGYRRDFRVYEGYLKDITKQVFNTMLVSVHKHNMSRMEKEAYSGINRLTPENAKKLRMFLDIRMLDILGLPSQFPDNYVNELKIDGTFYHKLTNDYWIRKKSPFIDKLLGVKSDYPEELRARRINRSLATLSNLEATWAMMPLLASPKFMITNRFSGGMTTIVNNGMDYFLKAHKLSEVNKYVGVKSYSDMVDFVSKNGGIESFIKNELVLSQNVKLGDVTEFVKDVMQVYKQGKDMPISRMYEIAKQRGLTQEFVDKAAYFMRASEIKNRVYTWFAHYMKAHDMLYKGPFEGTNMKLTSAEDPWLISMANKGVAATQYLYDALNRPAFARTSLGKMLTRFQLYTYNNLRWRKQLMDAARYEDWQSADGKRLANLVSMDMMVLTLATFFPGTMFSASLNQPYGWVKDLTAWLFGDEKEREKAFFGSIPYPANIVQPLLPPFTRFLINPIVALLDVEKFADTLVWGMFPFGRMINETRKSIDNPLLMPEKSFGIPAFTLIRKIQADYKRREKEEQEGKPPAPKVKKEAE